MTASKISTEALKTKRWTVKEVEGLTLIFSPLLAKEEGLVHTFSTRLGGESAAPLDSFNLGRHTAALQQKEDAMQNRARLCEAMNLNFRRLVVPGQVHSNNVVFLKEPDNLPEIDGVATTESDLPLLLHFADCVPVIVYDRKKKAICIMHAGWKGTAQSIVQKGVELLAQKLESTPADMVAAVGPAICAECYPVSDDVAEKLLKTVADPCKEELVIRKAGQPHPNLKAINACQLLEAGVGEVDVSDYCTACQPELFYSHRQSGGNTGRQGAMVGLR